MSWHVLLAPLPADAVPVERPLAPPEVLASAEGAAIAGWRQLVVDLSAGCDGLRLVLVLLDADGALLSASDAVIYRREEGALVHFRHETVGGRFEPDGRFAGHHWISVSSESLDAGEALRGPSTGREATLMEAAALRELAGEILRRASQ
jgi:hypothetical protein